jgi:hypothetical protein
MTIIRSSLLILMLSGGLAPAAAATDFTALRNDQRVHDSLVGAKVAKTIEETCPSLSARMLYGVSEMLKLRKYARGLGYTNGEIKDYVDSHEEQALIYAVADAYLAGLGVVEGNVESYCAAGFAEIAKGTIAGSLLKED